MVSEDVPYPNMGGLAKHALNLSRALLRAGHEVDFLGGNQHPLEVAGEEGIFEGRFFGELNGQHVGWKETTLGMFIPQKRSWLAKHFAKIILRHARQYEVVHYHGHVPNVARYIPREINFVQTRHDQGSDCFLHTRFRNGKICEAIDPVECAQCIAPQPNLFQRAISKLAVQRYRTEVAESYSLHKTVFVSDMLKKNCARTLGSSSCGTIVHNFVDLDNLRRALQSTSSLPKSENIHVFVAGKLYFPKGIETFLHELFPNMPLNMHVTVAGDGEDEARLRAQFESEQIHFLGWCTPEKTLQMAASSNAVVVPSIWEEPFGSTTLEGLLLGKPTYALAQGGTLELGCYAAPGQLRLHPDMQSLVQDLISIDPRTSHTPLLNGLGGADHAVEQLLPIYHSSFRN